MNSKRLLYLTILVVFGFTANSRATDQRELLFSDDFENRTEIGDEYFTALGGPDAWQIQDGVLIGKQTNPEHGAVFRKELQFDDIDIEIDFRFSGGSRFNFVIDDKD